MLMTHPCKGGEVSTIFQQVHVCWMLLIVPILFRISYIQINKPPTSPVKAHFSFRLYMNYQSLWSGWKMKIFRVFLIAASAQCCSLRLNAQWRLRRKIFWLDNCLPLKYGSNNISPLMLNYSNVYYRCYNYSMRRIGNPSFLHCVFIVFLKEISK